MDTKNITNISGKKSIRRQMIDELIIDLDKIMLNEKRLKYAIETLQYLCDHKHKEYEGTSPNGSKYL